MSSSTDRMIKALENTQKDMKDLNKEFASMRLEYSVSTTKLNDHLENLVDKTKERDDLWLYKNKQFSDRITVLERTQVKFYWWIVCGIIITCSAASIGYWASVPERKVSALEVVKKAMIK